MGILSRLERRRATPGVLVCGLAGVMGLLWGPDARGACVPEPPPTQVAPTLIRHLGKDCTDRERADQAVSAAEVLAALKEGKGVDLAGVVIVGDLLLDQLPPIPVGRLGPVDSPRLQDRLRRERLEAVQVVNGPIIIRDSVVRGLITSNASRGLLVIKGPVVVTGTTFERALDLSRTAIVGPVDFSDAVLLQEGFFVQALFDQPVRFEHTTLEGRARFHRSVFGDTATFARAGFNDFAEFLEVTFEKEANFSRTSFKRGTGFSGSRFRGALDFSEALFAREAFFLFTVFDREASFRQTVFRGRADFSDAQFQTIEDFTNVRFDVEPRFARTKVRQVPASPRGLWDPRVLYVVAAGLFAGTILLLLFFGRKAKGGGRPPIC